MTNVNLSRTLRLRKFTQEEIMSIPTREVALDREQWWAGGQPLLTPPEGQTKGYKTAFHGDYLAILHLSSDRIDYLDRTYITCEKATHGPGGCAENCIMWTGRGQRQKNGEESSVAAGRRKRTEWLIKFPPTFLRQLVHEISLHRDRAHKRGMQPCVRLNGTSDIVWEQVVPWLFPMFDDVQFIDYTKLPAKKRGPMPDNYTLAWSAQATVDTIDDLMNMIHDGRNVSVIVDEPGAVVRLKQCVSGDTADTWMVGKTGKLGILKPKYPLPVDHPTVYRATELRSALKAEGAVLV